MKSRILLLSTFVLAGLSACSLTAEAPVPSTRAVEVEGKCYEYLDAGVQNLASECFVLLADLGKPASSTFGLGILALSLRSLDQAKYLFSTSYQLGLMNGLLGLAIAEELNGEILSARRHYEQFLQHQPTSVQGLHNYAQHLRLHSRHDADLLLAATLLSRASILNQEQVLSPYYEQQAESLRDSSMQ